MAAKRSAVLSVKRSRALSGPSEIFNRVLVALGMLHVRQLQFSTMAGKLFINP